MECSVQFCDRPVFVKDKMLCRPHYARWWRHGDPLAGGRTRLDDTERFWSYVTPPTKNPMLCRLWTGATIASHDLLYGRFTAGGKKWLAHRWIYSQSHGPIPPGLVVRHRCDNSLCVRRSHLQLGTQAENNQDTAERGRAWWQSQE